MFAKINIFMVVKDHLQSLRNFESSKISHYDIVVFYVFPAIFSFIFIFLGYVDVKSEFWSVVLNVSAILSGLLLNLLVFVYSVLIRVSESKIGVKGAKWRLLKEVYFNISYSVLISLLLVSLCVFYWFIPVSLEKLFSFLGVFLLLNLLLTLLMILKRVHALFNDEINMISSDDLK